MHQVRSAQLLPAAWILTLNISRAVVDQRLCWQNETAQRQLPIPAKLMAVFT
jgi:hypothetical protein